MYAGRVIPTYSHTLYVDGKTLHVLEDGSCGIGFKIDAIDLEATLASDQFSSMDSLLSELPESARLRVELQVAAATDQSRTHSGYTNKQLSVWFEASQKLKVSNQAATTNWLQSLPTRLLASIRPNPIGEDEMRTAPSGAWLARRGHLDSGDGCFGIVRLVTPSASPIALCTLYTLLDQVPKPFACVATVQRIPKAKTSISLRQKASQIDAFGGVGTHLKRQKTAKALEETELGAEYHCEIELQLVFERLSEEALKKDLKQAKLFLSQLGDASIETVGLQNSFRAAQPLCRPHVTFIETKSNLLAYLPIATFGSKTAKLVPAKRDLFFQRIDGSQYAFDLFHPEYLASNVLISGKTGSGKSVLASLLTTSLLKDPSVHIYKIDVGGSYKKECSSVGGLRLDFNLDLPSGLNPFSDFKALSDSPTAQSVLAAFLATLITETVEKALPRSELASLEQCIRAFATKLHNDPTLPCTIDSFISLFSSELPRLPLIKRWAIGGVYENAIKSSATQSEPHRYQYFNFQNLVGATSSDFSGGVFAALIAKLNLEVLSTADSLLDTERKRIVLFCDETKFFLKRHIDFFLLTTANFRKFGHATVLIGQNMMDFDRKSLDGEDDQGLILNSPIRFFLPADVSEDYLRQRFSLSDLHLKPITKSVISKTQTRPIVLQDGQGTRLLYLTLSPSEYWRLTSDSRDNEKLSKLLDSVPGLSTEEAIRCLASLG